jgi:hypothetical protein
VDTQGTQATPFYVMAVHGEDAQGKTADSKVKALDGNLWVQLPPITPKTFLKSFQKGIDKSQGL